MAENETERRFARVEFREDGAGEIAGTAVRYGDEARILNFRERFDPGAFGEIGDVILNLHHDRSRPLARTGGGLAFDDSAESLSLRAELPETGDGRDARELLRRGVLRGLSIEFEPVEEDWSGDLRTIRKARLHGVALVDRPAYPESTAALARRFERQGARRYWPLVM